LHKGATESICIDFFKLFFFGVVKGAKDKYQKREKEEGQKVNK
jgi:hypothetical protein